MTATNPPVARHITIGLTAVGAEALATVQAHDEVNPSDAVGRALRVYAHLLQDPAAGLEVPGAGATTPLTDQQLADRIANAIWERQNPGRSYADCEPRWQADAIADADAVLAEVQPELDRLAAELSRVRAELATARAAAFREAARVLEDTGRDDDAVNLLDNIADGVTANMPTPAPSGA